MTLVLILRNAALHIVQWNGSTFGEVHNLVIQYFLNSLCVMLYNYTRLWTEDPSKLHVVPPTLQLTPWSLIPSGMGPGGWFDTRPCPHKWDQSSDKQDPREFPHLPPPEDTVNRRSMSQEAGSHPTVNLPLPWTCTEHSFRNREEHTSAVDKPPRLWYFCDSSLVTMR